MAKLNNEIIITDIQYRPCYVKDNGKMRKALFHKYTKARDYLLTETTHSLVEYEDGQVDEIDPTLIKFCDSKLKEYVFKEDKHE